MITELLYLHACLFEFIYSKMGWGHTGADSKAVWQPSPRSGQKQTCRARVSQTPVWAGVPDHHSQPATEQQVRTSLCHKESVVNACLCHAMLIYNFNIFFLTKLLYVSTKSSINFAFWALWNKVTINLLKIYLSVEIFYGMCVVFEYDLHSNVTFYVIGPNRAILYSCITTTNQGLHFYEYISHSYKWGIVILAWFGLPMFFCFFYVFLLFIYLFFIQISRVLIGVLLTHCMAGMN